MTSTWTTPIPLVALGVVAGTSITESTTVELALVIGAVAGVATLMWKARGDRDDILSQIKEARSEIKVIKSEQATIKQKLDEIKREVT